MDKILKFLLIPFSFQTRSYLEGIWHALCGVDYKPKDWDLWDADITILRIVSAAVDKKLKESSESNEWFEEVKHMGELADEILNFNWLDTKDIDAYKKLQKEFAELLGKYLFHLWY